MIQLGHTNQNRRATTPSFFTSYSPCYTVNKKENKTFLIICILSIDNCFYIVYTMYVVIKEEQKMKTYKMAIYYNKKVLYELEVEADSIEYAREIIWDNFIDVAYADELEEGNEDE